MTSAWPTNTPSKRFTGGTRSGRRKLSFAEVTTDRVRIVVNNALYGRSRIIELEALGVAAAAPSPARVNVALAANGAKASASSSYGAGFSPQGPINGDRKGLNWESGGGWADATANTYADWLQVNFAGVRTINEVDLFTLQDNYTNPGEPTETMTCGVRGLLDFQVQYWDGSAWQTVPGGSVTANDKVWRRFTFPEISTGKIRVYVSKSRPSYSRIVELEAY